MDNGMVDDKKTEGLVECEKRRQMAVVTTSCFDIGHWLTSSGGQ